MGGYSSKLGAALDAASRGLPVFPQKHKRPGIRGWPTNAATDPAVIKRWWAGSPGADIGIALPPDIYVLDADSRNALRALDGLNLPTTLRVATARGAHVYFRVPHELRRLTPAARPSRSLDWLEGKGRPGPVTWAGSEHESGLRYRLLEDAPIADMPARLVRDIGPRNEAAANGEATPAELAQWQQGREESTPMTRDEAHHAVQVARRRLAAELPAMDTGWGDALFRAGAALGPYVAAGGLEYSEAVVALEEVFAEHDRDAGDPAHALRSLARGVAAGAREARP